MGQTPWRREKEKKIVVSIPASTEYSVEATRRYDVDTSSLEDTGVIAAKDHMTVKDYLQVGKSIGRKVGQGSRGDIESCSEASAVGIKLD
jgi:hypothetical protein